MNIPCVVIGITEDKKVVTYLATMDKGQALVEAKEQANAPDKGVVEIRLMVGIGAGIGWRRAIRPAPVAQDAAPAKKVGK